jgi:hypothetical protein
VLSTQIHHRFNAGRSITTTQRRLKRLSDAGLVARFQFHRRDGGGVPMCYVITAEGLRILRGDDGAEPEDIYGATPAVASGSSREPGRRLREARRDVHVAGWALALERLSGSERCTLRGPQQSVLSPPSLPGGRRLSPTDLRLPGGRAPHDFIRTDAAGEEVEVDHFETLRPDAIVELAGTSSNAGADREHAPPARATAVDVFVEFDDRLPSPRAAGKLERYDHFLTGWVLNTHRYGRRLQAAPMVVFVCRDRTRARECARRADPVLKACRAYAGDYPVDWAYPARESILFASERDVHEGLASAYGVPGLPPQVRVAAAQGDARASEALAEPRQITC